MGKYEIKKMISKIKPTTLNHALCKKKKHIIEVFCLLK